MTDKKALTILKKYYLPYKTDGRPSCRDVQEAIAAGVLVPDSVMSHNEMIGEIKTLSERISLTSAAKAFLYSLSSGDMRYRSALSSLVWARSLPVHDPVPDSKEKTDYHTPACMICGCTHGIEFAENVDWNEYGVFRYLPPTQYGREPDYTCAEYVLNDLRGFEKLPAVEPCGDDFRILNSIFACAKDMKPHNKDSALTSEIRSRKFINASGNAICCILGILSICGILESDEHNGFLHSFTDHSDRGMFRDGPSFYPLNFWRGKNGVNYSAVTELFDSFCGDELTPEKAVLSENDAARPPARKISSKAKQYFSNGTYLVDLTAEERRYLALDPIDPNWETVSVFSVTHSLKKHTILFYDSNTIVKVIHEELSANEDGSCIYKSSYEFDTHLETDNRIMLLPLTSRGRAKPVTPTNVMAVTPFGCEVYIYLKKDHSTISARNARNEQEIAIGEKDRVRKIMTNDDLHGFMRYYISTCPDDYFERIAAVRTMEHQTVRFRAGDIFRCQTDRTHYTYGLILGKTREIEKWKELPENHSFRHLMTQPIVIRMYDFVTSDRDMTADTLSDKPLRPPEICSDCDIIWGTHKIVSHKELEPDDIQFRLQLARQTAKNEHFTPFTAEFLANTPPGLPGIIRKPVSLYVEWGFVSFEIPWEDVPDDMRDFLDTGKYYDGGVSLGIRGDLCGRTLSDILEESPKRLIRYDLLLPENRGKFNFVMHFLGLLDNCTLDDFAAKYGGISRQRYIELVNAPRTRKASSGK